MKLLLIALTTIAFSSCKEEEAKVIIISDERTPAQEAKIKAKKERIEKFQKRLKEKYGGIEKPEE